MTVTRTLAERDQACVWHPYTQMRRRPAPLAITRAEGVYLHAEDGRRILDGISSWWVNIHGHAHPVLNAALARQASEMAHVIFAGCTHRPAVELAERLVEILPPGLTRVFYSDDGSTAVEVALKMVWQYWRNRGESGRRRFIALEHAYHGDTVGAMSVSEPSSFTAPFEPLLFSVERVPDPYCYRSPVGRDPASCRIECLDRLDACLREHGDSVAGVIVEPMLQGVGGMIVWPAGYLAGVRDLCRRHGTLLIADEVMTGFGRTGRMFACDHEAVTPDVICLSKALTAGYMPLAATVATDEVYEAFLSDDRQKTFFHGHSYTANPLACAVALASLDLFREQAVLERVAALEAQLRTGFDRFRAIPCVGDVRVIGGMGAVELKDLPAGSPAGYFDDRGPRLAARFLEHDLLLRPLGNVVYFMPPYVISEAETARVLETMHTLLSDLGTGDESAGA